LNPRLPNLNPEPYFEAKGGFIVAATNNPNSTLAKMCDMHVTIPSNGRGRRRPGCASQGPWGEG